MPRKPKPKKPERLNQYLVFSYYNDEQQITVDHVLARNEEAAEQIIYKLRPEILHCSAEEAVPFCQHIMDQAYKFECHPKMWKDWMKSLAKDAKEVL